MPIYYVTGDLFLSSAQILAHGVSCRGNTGGAIARAFWDFFPEMFEEYRCLCAAGALSPGSYFIWRQRDDWVLNLATQLDGDRIDIALVQRALELLSRRYLAEDIKSVAMPLLGADQDERFGEDVRASMEQHFAWHPLPVYVYAEHRPEVEAIEPRSACVGEQEPVLFHTSRHHDFKELSNFYQATFVQDQVEYQSAEHYYQSQKSARAEEQEAIRTMENPLEAMKRGRQAEPRPDWEEVKIDVMRTALRAKFSQNHDLQQVLLSTGDRPLHEDSPNDQFWGWFNGEGRDLMGRLLVEVRAFLRYQAA